MAKLNSQMVSSDSHLPAGEFSCQPAGSGLGIGGMCWSQDSMIVGAQVSTCETRMELDYSSIISNVNNLHEHAG